MDVIDYIPRRLIKAKEEVLREHPKVRRRAAEQDGQSGGLWQRFVGNRNKKRSLL